MLAEKCPSPLNQVGRGGRTYLEPMKQSEVLSLFLSPCQDFKSKTFNDVAMFSTGKRQLVPWYMPAT